MYLFGLCCKKIGLFRPPLSSLLPFQGRLLLLLFFTTCSLLMSQNSTVAVGGGSLHGSYNPDNSDFDQLQEGNLPDSGYSGSSSGSGKSSRWESPQPTQNLLDVYDLRAFFTGEYLVVDRHSFKTLLEHSQTHKAAFLSYNGKIWVKDWPSSSTEDPFSLTTLLCCFSWVKGLKVTGWDGNWDLGGTVQRFATQQRNIHDIKIKGGNLTNKAVKRILKSISSVTRLDTLDLRGNPALAEEDIKPWLHKGTLKLDTPDEATIPPSVATQTMALPTEEAQRLEEEDDGAAAMAVPSAPVASLLPHDAEEQHPEPSSNVTLTSEALAILAGASQPPGEEGGDNAETESLASTQYSGSDDEQENGE